jgi:N-acetylneuraminate synthase/N,N'-diacetyllegionaminate synthase
MSATITLGGRAVGAGAPVFVIAEAGVNHNGDPALAHQLIEIAAAAGADAVKFQTFRSEALVSRHAPKAPYQVETTGGAESQLDMLRRLELSGETFVALAEACRRRGLLFLSSPFDIASADDLEALGVVAFKTGSGELTNLPLLEHLAAKGRPIIVSTGMATLDEVETAVATVRGRGTPLALLHCVSAYPAPPEECNLRAMDSLRERFGCPVGFSDHTPGITVAVAAIARGASILEKHFTVDRSLPGPDHRASLDPGELTALIAAVRQVEAALGDGQKRPTPAELPTRTVARKSLVAARALRRGEALTAAAVAVKRPGTGIAPGDLPRALGRRLRRDLDVDEVIEWAMLE